MSTELTLSQMARRLGRLGGIARAGKLTPSKRSAIASQGGHAANSRRSDSERRDQARRAAQARWLGRDAVRLIEENARRFITIRDIRKYFK